MATIALQMDYTDPLTLAEYPESYWTPRVVLDMDAVPTRINVEFFGYVSSAAKGDGARPFTSQEFEILSPVDRDANVGDGIDGVFSYAIGAVPFFATATPVTE